MGLGFKITRLIGLHIESSNALSLTQSTTHDHSVVVCSGAGVVVLPIHSGNTDLSTISEDTECEFSVTTGAEDPSFFYEPVPPKTRSPLSSPVSSPVLRPYGSGSPKRIRVNKSQCLDVAPIQQILAVGESGGYMPRILLYSLTSGATLDMLSEQHQFGVQLLKFSPSGNLLVSLGTPQDGFIYVWSVKRGKLELFSSNRCISEVRDLTWLNESQIVTVGVRHVKLWTVAADDSVLAGRNVILGPISDQDFETVQPISSSERAEFLVGSTKGFVFRLPDNVRVTSQLDGGVRTMCSYHGSIYVGTSNRIYSLTPSSSRLGETYEQNEVCNSGTRAMKSSPYGVLYLSQERNSVQLKFLNNSNSSKSGASMTKNNSYLKTLQKKGLKISSNYGSQICWSNEDAVIIRWPDEIIETPLTDILVADEFTKSSNNEYLVAGSLSGDIFLGGELVSAHNGPVTDVHIFSRNLAVTASRDRTVQIWVNSNAKWGLKQTLEFTTPILKIRLCETEGKIALLCCGANKTLYVFINSEGTAFADDDSPAFPTHPRTVLIKAMPYDLVEYGDTFILSTNDKMVTILRPFNTDMLEKTWRPTDANDETVNLLHISPIMAEGMQLLIGAASNKSILAMKMHTGDVVASFWGFGEQISGLGTIAGTSETKPLIIGAGDVLMVTSLQNEKTPVHREQIQQKTPPHNSDRISPLQLSRLNLSPETPQNPAREDIGSHTGVRAHSRESGSPMRKVFNRPSTSNLRSRSVSPVRSLAKLEPTSFEYPASRSAINTTGQQSMRNVSTTISPGGKEAGIHEYMPPRLGGDMPRLKLSTPSLRAEPIVNPNNASEQHNLVTMTNRERASDGGLTQELMKLLGDLVRSDVEIPADHKTELKASLIAALNKLDGLAVGDIVASRIEARLSAWIQDRSQ